MNRTFVFLFLGLVICPLIRAQQAVETYTIQTVAGSNSVGDGGPALAALFSQVEGVAVDVAGNVYVADADNHRVRKITPDGTITTVAGIGIAGFSGDGGLAAQASLNQPYGLAVDVLGNLYIADLGNARIRKVTTDGKVQTVAGGGTVAATPGSTHQAVEIQLTAPRNLAVDLDGTLYLSDFGANIVYRVSAAGAVDVLAGTGVAGYSGDASSANMAQLNAPAGIALDHNGSVYIADSGNNCIRQVFRNVMSTIFTATAPTGVAFGGGSLYIAASNYFGTLYSPVGNVGSALDVAIDASGNVYATSGQFVYETNNNGNVSTIAGSGLPMYFGGDGGPASIARLHTPSGIAEDSLGNKYIADSENHRIRQIAPNGTISTVAGIGAAGSDGDGGLAAGASLNSPESVAVDANNNLFIADTGNNAIRKVTTDGRIATIAAGLNAPGYVSVDPAGNLYVADTGNDRVIKLTPAGALLVVAQVLKPAAVMPDSKGNIWISEPTRVSKVDATGNYSSVVDNLKAPRGLAMTSDGELLIAETGTSRILSWTAAGGMQVLAGSGTPGWSGDGGTATAAEFNAASDILVDAIGMIWIVDTGNNCIRVMTASAAPPSTTTPPADELSSATVVNAASLLPGDITPGEIVSIFGSGYDPKQTQLFFDGSAATTFYIGANQINALVPGSVKPGTPTQISISVAGSTVNQFPATVASAAPAIFTVGSGSGQAAAINADGTVNSDANPAARGSVIVLYATGQGQDPTALSLTISGYTAPLVYAGPAPGFAGLMQINAQIPGGFLPPGDAAVVLTVGNAASQAGVTIAVR